MGTISRAILAVPFVVFAAQAVHAAGPELKTQKEKLSYAIGFQVAQSIKQQNVDVDPKALAQAVQDVLTGQPLKLSMDQMRAAVQTFQEQQVAKQKAAAEQNKKAADKFLAQNKTKKGVKTLPSGVQYIVEKQGKGPTPKPTDVVEVNYRGTLLNGQEFDSSYKRGQPATFRVNGVIQGWQDALVHMHVGGKWKVFIPPALAYGERGAGNTIGPNELLIFEIELLGIKEAPKQQ